MSESPLVAVLVFRCINPALLQQVHTRMPPLLPQWGRCVCWGKRCAYVVGAWILAGIALLGTCVPPRVKNDADSVGRRVKRVKDKRKSSHHRNNKRTPQPTNKNHFRCTPPEKKSNCLPLQRRIDIPKRICTYKILRIQNLRESRGNHVCSRSRPPSPTQHQKGLKKQTEKPVWLGPSPPAVDPSPR